jgi:L-fuculose-phosphate aldolase
MDIKFHFAPMTHIANRILVEQILREAVLRCLPKPPAAALGQVAEAIHNAPTAVRVKEEIVRVGKKLWDRQYVDGNGGNISYRIGHEYVICTPTMCSKGDLTRDDLSLIDMDNVQLCGDRQQTSEVLLHLEIYKAVPRARAVIHCHPPHATAYAITGLLPPTDVIPEQEVFVGPLAITPYETPGTKKFAETVLPYVRRHNTILLGNHGIVCWADTVTHAEWLVEIVDTYCRTILLARSLDSPIKGIAADKIADLLDIKNKLGLPDSRFDAQESAPSEAFFVPPDFCSEGKRSAGRNGNRKGVPQKLIEQLVNRMTDQVLELLSKQE